MRWIVVAGLICLSVLINGRASAMPVVFWVSEPVSPGDVVMAYGGDLEGVRSVEIRRLPDTSASGTPKAVGSNTGIRNNVPILQASDHSLKFILPKSFAAGVYALEYGGKSPS